MPKEIWFIWHTRGHIQFCNYAVTCENITNDQAISLGSGGLGLLKAIGVVFGKSLLNKFSLNIVPAAKKLRLHWTA